MNIPFDHDVFARPPIDYRLEQEPSAGGAAPGFRMRPGAGREYACFAIWEGGRGREDDIVAELSERFTLLADFLIHWSDRHYRRNIQRLYLRPGAKGGAGYDEKIGRPPFRFIIVEDTAPSYTWGKSVSGDIEPCNRNVVREKYRFRAWFDAPYQVHSSNNIREFYFQSVLLLGLPLLAQVLCHGVTERRELHRDLEGADGWTDWASFFSVLNVCADYLVLRNFDDLPRRREDGDIDFLCDDLQWLASAANVHQHVDCPYKGRVEVGGEWIPVDIRFIGDGYYSAAWEKDVVRRRVFQDGLYVPRIDDHFFTLLYHCKVHKRTVAAAYETLLKRLASEMGFDWFAGVELSDDAAMGRLLEGYMRANNYYYERPMDRGVYENKSVTRIIDGRPYANRVRSPLIRAIKKRLRPYLMPRRS